MTNVPRRDPSASLDQQPVTPEDLDRYIPFLYSQLSTLWQSTENKLLDDTGLNAISFRALSILHIYKVLTVNEISILAATEQSTASRMIDSITEAGLVERQISATDMRKREIKLTRKGKSLLRKTWPVMETHYQRLVSGIGDADLDVTMKVLKQMLANVREIEN